MKILKKIIISVAMVMALIGNALVEGSLIGYAKDKEFGMKLVASESTADYGACVAMLDNLLQYNDFRNEKLRAPDNYSSKNGRSNLNYSDSFYRTDKNEGFNQGLSGVDWPKSVAPVVLNSRSDASALSKVGLESGSGGKPSHYEQAESNSVAENGISGSLLVSILALIAIVAVARRNVSERSD